MPRPAPRTRRAGGKARIGAAHVPARASAKFSDASVRRHLERVRRLCMAMPESSERLSHAEPTFFAGKRVFVMFSTNHHDDGHLACILPVEPGLQGMMLAEQPGRFYYPAYVGSAGWVGVELDRVSDRQLAELIEGAWRLVAPKRAVKAWDNRGTPGTAPVPRSASRRM